MKKILISVLLVSLAFAAFADDAKVLPEGVMRLNLINSLINADKMYDEDGKKNDSNMFDTIAMDNLGVGLEFGVTDMISAAVQWAPGTMLYGKLESKALELQGLDPGKVTFGGLADLFIGAKIQAFNANNMRFCLAPGVVVPLDSYDPSVEGKAIVDGDEFRIMGQSKTESLGLGLRLYFDYQITENFYINVYNQTRYYVKNKKYDFTDTLTYAQLYGTYGETFADDKIKAFKGEYEYPVYLDFELEPHYDLTLSNTGSMGFGLPVKFSFNDKVKVDGDAEENTDSYSFSVNPGISFFYTGGIPFEVAASYDVSLMGKNVEYAANVFTVKLKLFYDFY